MKMNRDTKFVEQSSRRFKIGISNLTNSLHFAQPLYELERPALKTEKYSYVGAELTFVASNVLKKSP